MGASRTRAGCNRTGRVVRVLDPGHRYELDHLDDEPGNHGELIFVKRCTPPEKYPGNVGAYPGTTSQEVLRALLDRARYVTNQFPNPETTAAIGLLEAALYLFEARARRLRGGVLAGTPESVAVEGTCSTCGHVQCGEHAAN